MAAPSRILALDIGSQTVGMADFHATSTGGLVLNNYRIDEIPLDVEDEARPKICQAVVHSLAEELGVKLKKVNYAVSAQSVFTRFVKLPSVEQEKVDQIIQFEAQQNVPFPIHEVVWDYQLVGTDKDAKFEVVLVAIKADLLNNVNQAVEAAGFVPAVIDVAPMAVYNAFRYNYSELSGCSLIVDIGSKTTNLIFSEPGKVFSRSIPIGGHTVTSSIAKELKLAMQDADGRKKEDCFVSLGGAYADPDDPDVARMSKLARNTLTRLHAEINRSISFYKAQQQGSEPVRIFLAGGSVSMPYMREFFSEKLQKPIEYLNPLRNVAVSSAVDAEKVAREAHMLGELVGLALRDVSECPMELNLRPSGLIHAEKMRAKQPYLAVAALCLLLALAGWLLFFNRSASVKELTLSGLEARVKELKRYERKIEEVQKEIAAVDERAQPLYEIVRARQFWAEILNDLNARIPDRFIWITNLEPLSVDGGGELKPVVPAAESGKRGRDEDGEGRRIDALRIKGLYLENPRRTAVIDAFANAIAESPYFENPEITTRATETGEAWAYDYEIQANFKNPIDAQ